MARVVVVGGGFGGLASAARLAKLGHEVTLLEAGDTLGGALGTVAQDGFSWDTGPTWTTLPGVLRDLFRKSGRPLDAELDLVELPLLREHRFDDDSVLRLPGGSRAAQLAAVDELGPGLGRQWVDHVASYADAWEVVRRGYAEAPWDPDAVPKELAALLDGRETLHKRLRRTFRDERLRLVAAHASEMEGHDLRNVPAWVGLTAYLEQRFGVWTVDGGMGRLADALTARLATRGVTVVLGSEVRDLVVRGGRAVAVDTLAGQVDADVVVVAIDPRRLPVLAEHVRATMPALPPVVAHLGLEGEVPDLPHEVVLHGDPTIVVRTGGTAPEGHHAWTVMARGRLAEDLVIALARTGIKVRQQVVTRLDRSARDQVELWRGSPMGVLWQGRRTVRQRLGPRTPVPGVLAAGAHAAPGGGLAFVGLSASLVAQVVGPA
ncbi:NAD(P)/FAD-dependent oxidoreductase [Nocardioides sp. SYSU D00038]|uniref:phytoene desaturase family protein n=1 Tax=Nocardioides sp. SYSU D00038 TaxID=2812554 RepID=UPI001966DFC6|nr:FAD-dependent oxidoreductase [Nocardioides sp. SYSU D00038]